MNPFLSKEVGIYVVGFFSLRQKKIQSQKTRETKYKNTFCFYIFTW